MCAALLDATCDDVVEKPERKGDTGPPSDEQRTLILPKVNARATVWTVDHDLNWDAGLLVFLQAHTLLLLKRVSVDGASPVAHNTRCQGQGVARDTGRRSRGVYNRERVGLEDAPGEEHAEANMLAGDPPVLTVMDMYL